MDQTPIKDSDVGREPEPGGLQPPNGIFGGSGVTGGVTGLTIDWWYKGRPHALAEPSFQLIRVRFNPYIWHKVKVWCKSDTAFYSIEFFSGSKFPSHKLWIDGALQRTVNQGPFSGLWYLGNP
jgi:hypothetical protein